MEKGMAEHDQKRSATTSVAVYFKKNWFWWVVTVAALTPLGWLGWRALNNALGVDPVSTINNLSGRAAMITLFLSLACTPINTVFGFRRVLTVRKSLGLVAFVYASLHLVNFVGLDYGFDWALIFQDAVLDKPYILAGTLALLILIPLAITSTRGWMKRLGKKWKQLHRLVYGAGVMVVLHFLWQAKAGEQWEPLIYAAVLALLLALRIPPVRRRLSLQRGGAASAPARSRYKTKSTE
jgi:sulfoxide reductase heme-binding subunit YedZ